MCGYCNVAYVSLLNDEVSSESNKQNQPGTLSNKQNQPGTLCNKQNQPGTLSNKQNQPGTLSNKQNQPGRLSNKQNQPGRLSNKQNQPGTLSNKQNQPGTLSYFGVIIFKLQIWQAPPCMFLDLDSDSVHEHAKRKQLGQYPAMLTSLVSGPDILLKPTPQMIP